MPLSSLADAPSLTRPRTPSPSLYKGTSSSLGRLGTPPLPPASRNSVKDQACIDALFDDDDSKGRKEEERTTGSRNDSRWSSNASALDLTDIWHKKETGDALATAMEAEIVDADLKSLGPISGSALDPTTSQKQSGSYLVEVLQKRASRLPALQDALGSKVSHSQSMVGFCGDVNSKVLQDCDKTETVLGPSSSVKDGAIVRSTDTPSPTWPNLDDEWGPSDILSMLPDEADAKILEPTRKESTAYPSLIEAQGCPTSKMEVPSEFGGYQPSLLSSGARRSPVAGRRKCALSSRSKSASFEEEASDAVALSDLLTPEPNKRGNCGLSALRDPEGKGECVVVTSSKATASRKTTISLPTLPLDHQLQAAKSLRGASEERPNTEAPPPKQSLTSSDAQQLQPSPPQMTDCSSGDSKTSRKTVTASGEKEGVGEMVVCKREVTFKDQILAERNCSQANLDLEKSHFEKEKEELTDQIKRERVDPIEQRKCEKEALTLERQEAVSAREASELEKEKLAVELKKLIEENITLKEEVVRVENERLRFEMEISDLEVSHEEVILQQFGVEREEAQRLAVQLSSEVQLLKNSSILAEEKLESLKRTFENEMEMVKALHSRELEAKETQLSLERQLLTDNKTTMETLSHLLTKADDWSNRAKVVQESLVADRELCNHDKATWMGVLESTVVERKANMQAWESQSDAIRNQFVGLVSTLETDVKEMKSMQLDERERLNKEHLQLQALQDSLQAERAQSLAELAIGRQKFEEMRNVWFQEKETFLAKCMEERKEIAAEREVMFRIKEQALLTDSAFEKQLLEHSARMQSEADEVAKQRAELERAREVASEIAQEVEDGRHELELQHHTFERDLTSLQAFGLQAQQKLEEATELKKAAVQLKMEAETLNHQISQRRHDIEAQRSQAQLTQNELLALKRKHDEERLKLAFERQQLSIKKKDMAWSTSHELKASTTSLNSPCSVLDAKPQFLYFASSDSLRKHKLGRQMTEVTTSLISNKGHPLHGPGPNIAENIQASLCLQAQEDFLAAASQVLRDTTQATNNLISRNISSRNSHCSK